MTQKMRNRYAALISLLVAFQVDVGLRRAVFAQPAATATPATVDSPKPVETPAVAATPSGSASTEAAPPTKAFDLWTSPTLTGDWGGLRKTLAENGVEMTLYYNQQFQKNFRGGLDTHHAQRLSGSYDLSLLFDFEKMGFMEDAGFFFRAAKGTWSDGINPNKVGAINNVNQDAGDDHPIFINKWWFWKKFLDNKVELRLGLLQTNKDLFDVSPYANHEDKDFINRGSIRNSTIPHRNGIGAFLRITPVEWAYVQAAVLDAQYRARRTGFDTAFHDEAYFVGYWEAGLKPKLPSAKGDMPGGYRVGAWYDPTIKTVFRDTLGGLREQETRGGDVGYYLGFDQMVWKENENAKDMQGLGVFGRYGHAHGDVNRITDYWSLGTSWKGLIDQRDHDVAALAVSQVIVSDRYADERRLRMDRETAYELYYAVQVAPWYIVTPHLQFITNPGGGKDAHDAIVAGVRMRVTF